MAKLWPHQERMIAQLEELEKHQVRRIAAVSATGTGKSRVMYEILQKSARKYRPTIVYCNRRLLFEQLAKGLYDQGITFGARAAGHKPQLVRDIQLAMIQTERSRVLQDSVRQLHAADLVLVDEAHLMANGSALEILRRHAEQGATVIGFTATPSDIGHYYDRMIIGATPSEGRECGALLRARCFGPDMPDRRFVKRLKTGAEKVDGKWQTIWLRSIFGRVIDHWERYNPEHRPTIMFAPGVKESLWFAKKMYQAGINAAHIDSGGVWYGGHWYPGDEKRREVLDAVRCGEVEILSNRFVMREAVDIPEFYHCILATKFGSETTFLQAVGRVLRNHASLPGHVIVQDHGANFYDHGSPNQDRSWMLTETAEERAYVHRERMRQDVEPEPYTCPECFALRRTGGRCPECGHVSSQRVRKVVQANGSLKDMTGKVFNRRRVASVTAQDMWIRTYWSHYKQNKTFRQAYAAFGYKCSKKFGYWAMPSPDWPLMPTRISDEVRRVSDVGQHRLIPLPEKENSHAHN